MILNIALTDGKLYGYLMDNADPMRHIILVLIALIALVGLMPSGMSKDPAPFEVTTTFKEGETSLLVTPSQAAFLNDSWKPTPFVAPYASDPLFTKKAMSNNTTNTTYAIFDFLKNDTNTTTDATTNASMSNYTAVGGNIYEFIKDDWTPSREVEVILKAPFTKGKMS